MSFVAALLALILVTPAHAVDEPDELVPGRITVVKTATTFTFTGKPATGTVLDLPDPANNPTFEGGTLTVTDTGDATNDAGRNGEGSTPVASDRTNARRRAVSSCECGD